MVYPYLSWFRHRGWVSKHISGYEEEPEVVEAVCILNHGELLGLRVPVKKIRGEAAAHHCFHLTVVAVVPGIKTLPHDLVAHTHIIDDAGNSCVLLAGHTGIRGQS